jgi:hypothetical protein
MSQRDARRLSPDRVMEWYEAMRESLVAYRGAVLAAFRAGGLTSFPRFLGMTADDIDEAFSSQREELDNVTVLSLMASAEAEIQADYDLRSARRKLRDPLSKEYSRLHSGLRRRGWFGRRSRPSFDDHLLEAIRASGIAPPHVVGHFRDILNLRHWLAHGRYWAANLGRRTYDPHDVYQTIIALTAVLPPIHPGP